MLNINKRFMIVESFLSKSHVIIPNKFRSFTIYIGNFNSLTTFNTNSSPSFSAYKNYRNHFIRYQKKLPDNNKKIILKVKPVTPSIFPKYSNEDYNDFFKKYKWVGF